MDNMNRSTCSTCEIISESPEDTVAFGQRLGSTLLPGSIVSLRGPLGSGKTMLGKGIAAALQIDEQITSPTFTLIQEYEGTIPLVHIDLYRIHSTEEFDLLGAEEFFYGSAVVLVEWSEVIEEYLPDRTIFVDIALDETGRRIIRVRGAEL